MFRSMTVEQMVDRVKEIDQNKRDMVDDPMTEAYGAPVGEFFEQWGREERALLGKIYVKTRLGSVRNRWAANRLERYMP